MNAICNRIDWILAKHMAGNLDMPFRDTVHIVTQIEREVGHVQHVAGASHILEIQKCFTSSEDVG
jgi:hypothetical protein